MRRWSRAAPAARPCGLTIRVAGKTGTAQMGEGAPHSWFAGFAPYERRRDRIAFAVVVEHGGYGAEAAAPIARKLVDAAQELGIIQDMRTHESLEHIRKTRPRDFRRALRRRRQQEPPEVAEIRFALLDEVRKKSYRSGGKRVFPYNSVHIHVRGVEDSRARFSKPTSSKYFERRDRKSGHARASASSRKTWKWRFSVPTNCRAREGSGCGSKPRRRSAVPKLPAHARKPRKLTVMEGKANRSEIGVDKKRINIGRTVDVYERRSVAAQRPGVQRGDRDQPHRLARARPHSVLDEDRRVLSLYNDRWYKRDKKSDAGCGIWIVRDGMSQRCTTTSAARGLESGRRDSPGAGGDPLPCRGSLWVG